MTDKEYGDWHQEVSNLVAGFLVSKITEYEAIDLANRVVLGKVMARLFWSETKKLTARIAPELIDKVLDCVSDVSLNDLVDVFSHVKRGDRGQETI